MTKQLAESRWQRLVSVLSGEVLLTSKERRSNGGAIILARALIVSLELFALAIALSQIVDPSRMLEFDLWELRVAFRDKLSWFGAIFAGVYAAFYTRFASQWSYLAGLYNQIKATEAQIDLTTRERRVTMAEWKAGFIEDADDLHLVAKPMFASIIRHWAAIPEVRDAFVSHTAGGEHRLNAILADAGRAHLRLEAVRMPGYDAALRRAAKEHGMQVSQSPTS